MPRGLPARIHNRHGMLAMVSELAKDAIGSGAAATHTGPSDGGAGTATGSSGSTAASPLPLTTVPLVPRQAKRKPLRCRKGFTMRKCAWQR